MDVIPLRRPRGGAAARLWRLANHDFYPDHNRWAYKLKRPPALLLAVAAGLAWPGVATRAVDVAVDWDRVWTSAGDSVEVRARLRNRLPVPVWGLRLVGLGGVEEAALPYLSAFGGREVGRRTTAPRRGVTGSTTTENAYRLR